MEKVAKDIEGKKVKQPSEKTIEKGKKAEEELAAAQTKCFDSATDA